MPARLEGRAIDVVRGIRRRNCDRGCLYRDECPLLAQVMRGGWEEVPALVDDDGGGRIRCLARQAGPGVGRDGPGLVGAEDLPLFEVPGMAS